MDVSPVLDYIKPYLPNIIAIGAILVACKIALNSTSRILRIVYKHFSIPRGYYLKMRIGVRLFISSLTFFLILFFIPGIDQKVIAIAGVAFGLLVSLSSTTTIGNAVAGVILYFTRPFHEGDRVEIDDIYGDVVSFELLFVHIKTIKDVIVSIPALQVLNGQITNFSQLDKTIAYVRLSLGYDIDPGLIEELLIEAAKDTVGVLEDPMPFVLVNSLNDYTVTYEINVYTDNPHQLIDLKSRLRRNIIMKFSCEGVQIMSPAYIDITEMPDNEKILPEGLSCKVKKPEVDEEGIEKDVVEAKKQLEEKKKEDIKIKDKN